MAEGGSPTGRSLEQTPTWAVAVVCLAFVIISLLLEQSIHHVSNWLAKRNKKALYEALEKLKAELMLLGFISLLLTVGQRPISRICIPKKIAFIMLPCRKQTDTAVPSGKAANDQGQKHARRLVWESMSSEQEVPWRRVLAAAGGAPDHCSTHGSYPLVSEAGMHQLHIFIFVLAVLHVLYSVFTIGLARAKVSVRGDQLSSPISFNLNFKSPVRMYSNPLLILQSASRSDDQMRSWKRWEKETQTLDYEFSNDPARFRLTHQTSFVRRHMRFWSQIPILKWIVCFFRQFFRSVTKIDYLTLRHGFIAAHLSTNSKFDFHKYIKRSLDDDFKSVVGISPSLWAFAVIFLLLNVYRWYSYFWLSLVPLVIILVIGTKLQVIITELALEIQVKHAVVKGTPIVQPTNELFWFGRPQLILFLIHFTLFQNAFQLASFLWIWYEFDLRSCFHERFDITMVRVIIGVSVQLLCSYITLPLYALVTQMGSHMKKAIFEEQTANALKRWQKNAKKNLKQNRTSNHSSSRYASRSSRVQSGETTPTHGSSPLHLIHRYKSMGDIESPDVSGRYYHSEHEASDLEMEASSRYPPQDTKAQDTAAAKEESTPKDVDTNSKEFSFNML